MLSPNQIWQCCILFSLFHACVSVCMFYGHQWLELLLLCYSFNFNYICDITSSLVDWLAVIHKQLTKWFPALLVVVKVLFWRWFKMTNHFSYCNNPRIQIVINWWFLFYSRGPKLMMHCARTVFSGRLKRKFTTLSQQQKCWGEDSL